MDDTPQDVELRVLERAYFLWLEHGRPEGRAEEFWLRACELEAAGGRPLDFTSRETLLDAQTPAHGYRNGG